MTMAAWAQRTPQTTTAKQTRLRAWWTTPLQVCLILAPLSLHSDSDQGVPLGQGLLDQ